ncbi:MAG: SCO family protein [Planctomycetota bacterium]|nr:MAG: SCO family protein [Planctomycetota bacterium]
MHRTMRPRLLLSTSALAVALLAGLATCGGDAGASSGSVAGDAPVIRTLSDFSFVDQTGAQRSLKDWNGHPFALAMVFTSCSGPCSSITAAMHRLQQALPSDSSIRLVSLSVDPATDTPAVLASYAQACGADTSRWTFLTGEGSHAFIRDSLKLAVDGRRPDVPEAFEPTHSSRIVAVDKQGRVRGYFEALDDVGWRDLRERMLQLEREQP